MSASLVTQRTLRLLALISLLPLAGAQQNQRPPGIKDLPIGISPAERALMGTIGMNAVITPPPPGPVRAAAEWDESDAVFCLWDNADLMLRLQQDGNDVIIISQNSAWWTNWLTSNGIPTTNFSFLSEPTDTFWVRDYGPWFIWDGNGDFGLVDNIYNRPRPKDDVIPAAVASTYGINYWSMDVIHTGGNYYTDGLGRGFSSRLVYTENPMQTEGQIHRAFEDYLGITHYATQDLDYDIEHIDTFGKPLAPDTILWGEFPENTTPWAYSEAALKRYEAMQTPYGWPYKIHRLPLFTFGSSWTAYVNSLQTNDRLIVPKYNTANDAVAQAIFEQAAPGYEVVLADAKGTKWGDSIHCRTRNLVRGDTVRIYPRPHWEFTEETLAPYVVTAEVIPHNGTSLQGNPTLFWSDTGSAPFNAAPMTATGNPDEFSGVIPAHPWGSELQYYVFAADATGTTKTAPFTAPRGTFSITVDDDDQVPELDHDALHGCTLADWPPTVEAVATDNGGIPALSLEYAIGAQPAQVVPMVQLEGTFRFQAELAGGVVLGDTVRYRVVASDGATPPNESSSPNDGWNVFPIVPKNRVLVVELDESHDSGELLVDVCDDLALAVQYTNEWPANPSDYEVLLVCLGMNPTNTQLTTAQANSLVSFLSAGGAAYLEGGNAWAQDSARTIYRDWFGVPSAANGAQLAANLVGQVGTPTEGMSFDYYGEGKSSDHLTLGTGAVALLDEGSQHKLAAYSTGTYDAVASSIQSGSLVDTGAPSHAKRLVAQVLDQLGQEIELIMVPFEGDPSRFHVLIQGDPLAHYRAFYSPKPDMKDVGVYGTLLLDRNDLYSLGTGVLDGAGRAEFVFGLPAGQVVDGQEIYGQVLLEDTSTGLRDLTNRDRVRIEL